MTEITIAIYENSKTDQDILISYLRKAERELQQKYEIYSFLSGKAFYEILSPRFDIVFLNIQLPTVYSESIIQKLKSFNRYVRLIFMSSSPDIFSLGYEYGAQNFLLKPLSYLQIIKEMKRCSKKEALLSEPFLWISNKSGLFKIYYSRLRFIETESRRLLFHYDGTTICHSGNFSDFTDKLPASEFFRCNNSYIVNLRYITSIIPDGGRYNIHLLTGETIPLSRSHYRDCLHLLQDT